MKFVELGLAELIHPFRNGYELWWFGKSHGPEGGNPARLAVIHRKHKPYPKEIATRDEDCTEGEAMVWAQGEITKSLREAK